MRIIQGTITCNETREIPVGSVVFITVSIGSNVIGHNTMQRIEAFPFKYRVEVDDESNQTTGNGENWSIRVNIENGEQTMFLNGPGNLSIQRPEVDLENLDIQLNVFEC
jgi:hypothetical protein